MSNSGKLKGTAYIPTSTNNNNCFVYDTKAKVGNSTSYACTSPTAVTFIDYNASSTCMYEGMAYTIPATINCNTPYDDGNVYGYIYLTCNTGVPAADKKNGLRGGI